MIATVDLYNIYCQYPTISTDTRNIQKDCIFFCLKGANFNGNQFAEEALKKGAAYVIVDEEKYVLNEYCLLVENVLETLQSLARFHRKQLSIPVIGITGTNGKTTTKELLHSVIATSYKVLSTKGNLNNHIGVPLTILAITKEIEIAIIEMGANHAHEIEFLCDIALPTMGIITNIGKAHLEGFGSIEVITETKTALYRAIKKVNGTVFVNRDDDLLMHYAKGIKQITYGTHPSANYIGNVEEGDMSCKVYLSAFNQTVTTQLMGKYNFYNIMAAIAVGGYFHIPFLKIQTALQSYTPDNCRSQLMKKATNTLILDAYNANPSSMKLAIENVAEIKNENTILILGDMKELGEDSLKEHQAIVNLIEKNKFTRVYLVGNEFALTDHLPYLSFSTIEEVSQHITKEKIENAVILIKGSRSMQMERIVDYI
ncbi:MAG: UDP-N-acetylmuramoyl-tripeptide--D-alanyl-D-alanine ligase [Bacteroidales bacterium]|jgi:UDP-N-acetylmuramoyl-tripeptide--D-alanyl-D-alanine ligase|nr:UDP-N-acetylmuramoyl-tripeptide--D-alanyl-D-alanine ligase [Bacteroidales bacterium]